MANKIRIIGVPYGQAPLWVRQAWIGLEIPLSPIQPKPGDTFLEVIDKTTPRQGTDGFAVNARVAIDLLSEYNPPAAAWWKREESWVMLHEFVFNKEACLLL